LATNFNILRNSIKSSWRFACESAKPSALKKSAPMSILGQKSLIQPGGSDCLTSGRDDCGTDSGYDTYSIQRSSIRLPERSCAANQCGRFPHPVHVWDGFGMVLWIPETLAELLDLSTPRLRLIPVGFESPTKLPQAPLERSFFPSTLS